MIKQTLAKICLWGAIPCLLGFPVAVAAYRWHWWSLGQSFNIILATFFSSLALLGLALILAFIAGLQKQTTTLKASSLAVILLIIPTIGLSLQAIKGKSLPKIHDISTDTTTPPEFVSLLPLRGENSNPLSYEGVTLAQQQHAAYPHIQPLLTPIPTKLAFTTALSVVEQLGWELIAQNQAEGRIEAVDTTPLWGFKDDVVIRIQETEAGSRLDLRSVSRVGLSDLGANAARIDRFVNAFNAKTR